MTNQQLKDYFEVPGGLSSLHLLNHDPTTDTVMYEERILTPDAADSAEIAMEPKTTTVHLWISMTGGTAE